MSNALFATQSPGMTMLMYIVFIGAMLYFFLIRPQKKQMAQRKDMLAALNTGTRIATAGGLVGYVRAVTEDMVYIEVAEGLILEFQKQAVASILDDDNGSIDENDESFEEEPVETVEEVDPDIGCIRNDDDNKTT